MDHKSSSDPRPHDQFLGIVLSLSSIIVSTGLDAVVKWIGIALPTGEVMFVRGATAVLVLLCIAWHMQKLSTLSLRKWFSYAPRTIFPTLAQGSWFLALTHAPLAVASAVGYTSPMFSMLFAMFTGERVSPLKWVALVAGFAGVLIMASPHLSTADASLIGMLLALAAALFASLVPVFTRRMSRFEDTVTISFYFAVTNTVAAAFTSVGGWVMPSPREWGGFGLIALIGTSMALLGNAALRYAEVSALVPLDYVGLVLSVLSGYCLFNEIPEPLFWAGLPLMLLPGLLTMWTEYRARLRLEAQPRLLPPADT